MKVRIQYAGHTPAAAARESLPAPLMVSLLFHGALFGLMLFGGLILPSQRGQEWGDEGYGGGTAVPVNLAPSVPLATRSGPRNPLASQTQELYAAEKAPATIAQPAPSRQEIQLAERDLRKKMAEMERRQTARELAQLQKQAPEGAIPGSTRSGHVSSPLYGMATGQGSGGIGFSGEFGSLYAWYVRTVRECIARHWDRGRIDAAVRSARRVYVEFDIMRDGAIHNERITTSSSNPSVDREALRAVQACSGRSEVGSEAKLPPLPRDYAGGSVHVEVWFEFKQ